jgi:type VI secretion system secreted protein VgrG
MEDVITISCPALPDGVRVLGFRGSEAISQPYALAIDLIVPHVADDAFDGLQGERLSLTFERGDGRPPLRWHGVVGALDVLHDVATTSLCTLILVPRLQRLANTHHSRIFVDETTPKILEAILKDAGFGPDDYELRLASSYKPREHVCQYHESDLDFLSRWMEREGIYYFFEQGDEHERLILTDSASYQQDFSTDGVRYVPSSGVDSNFKRTESIESWRLHQGDTPGRVRLKDYDYNRPDLDPSGSADVVRRGFGEMRLFGENFSTPEEGKRIATVRSQEILARRRVFEGTGNVPFLRSGYTFGLDEHPRASFNTKYLVTRITHAANQAVHALKLQDVLPYDSDELYRSCVTAIPATVQYRPPRAMEVPRVDGIVTAIVDGPAASKYAQIDKQGRYKVKVKFDEGDLADGRASTFVRMLQPHGGSPEGFHFPLRKGTEVLLIFLGGDPDRPVIAGVVPNPHTPSPVTSENHTKNVIHTGGNNRLELEDAEGAQHVTLSTPTQSTFVHMGAPRDGFHLVTQTEGRGLHKTNGDWHVRVHGDKDVHVQGPVIEKLDSTADLTVKGAVTEKLKSTRTTTVSDLVHETFESSQRTNVTGMKTTYVDGILTETCTGECSRSVGGLEEIHVEGTRNVEVTGAWTNKTESVYSLTAEEDIVLTSTGGKVEAHSQAAHWYNYGHEESLTFGAVNEVIIGETSDVRIGAVTDVYAAQVVETKLGGILDLTLGGKVEVEVGRTTKISSEHHHKAAVAGIEAVAQITLKSASIKIDAAGIIIGGQSIMIGSV